MNGQNLAAQLMQRYPHLKVLYTSGYSSGDTENIWLNQPGAGNGLAFLEKPFTPGALTRKVREALDRVVEGNGHSSKHK
jgi:FixJ family two-component response regulator